MILHLLFFSVNLIIMESSSVSAQANCTRVCRGVDRVNSVPYPFGFSDDCEIRLNCSDSGQILVGQYNVTNITNDRILIYFPANCGRRYEEFPLFNNKNFALTSQNGLLVQNCSTTLDDCVVSASRFVDSFNLQLCDSGRNNNISCYAAGNPDKEEFINLKRLEAAGCDILFSSITIAHSQGSVSQSMPVELEFQSMEFGWWVRGECECDQNAICLNVSRENRRAGYRCHCNSGFAGNGFILGDGCRRDKKDVADRGLIISIVLGFIVGLCIIAAPLTLSRSWKTAYFRIWSNVIKVDGL